MRQSILYMKLIDDLRKRKKMTVQKLTEGIISTKTYYRYKNGHTQIRATKIYKLIERLNADIIDLLYYFVKYFNNEINIDNYLLAITRGNSEFVEKAYKTMDKSETVSKERVTCIKMLYNKHLFSIGKLTQVQYQEYLDLVLSEATYEHENLYTLLCRVIILIDSTDFNRTLATWLLKEFRDDFYYMQRVPLYLVSLNYLLMCLVTAKYSNIVEYRATLDKFNEIALMYNSKTGTDLAKLYYAYSYYIENDTNMYKQYLFQYLNTLHFTFHSDNLHNKLKLVSQVFNIDPTQFVKEYVIQNIL